MLGAIDGPAYLGAGWSWGAVVFVYVVPGLLALALAWAAALPLLAGLSRRWSGRDAPVQGSV